MNLTAEFHRLFIPFTAHATARILGRLVPEIDFMYCDKQEMASMYANGDYGLNKDACMLAICGFIADHIFTARGQQ